MMIYFLSGFVWGQQRGHLTRKGEIKSQIRFTFLMYSAGIFPVLSASSVTIIHPSKEIKNLPSLIKCILNAFNYI